ncbi:hypothetical protein SAMD00019534_007020 [Acytostelium subglobosum LB1]|uniref:hypothetical protein n=1 Tax=Acytostelium subglobosum LB1 TaxID=1410327 RepID=UPI000644CE02|nr:hypothetical protein SAMD00019534_007020 [Acytostelium subglobosum LB1]GAM17527.1 hypothetical protein SAMD00019534_007020 [Acytostelium subglobosum LB1]|eukprot:XP_012759589.1 hypothetical protein SAMD00019534_007020 [Acytostelium subglobosum LB1]
MVMVITLLLLYCANNVLVLGKQQPIYFNFDTNARCEPWVEHSFCTGLIKNPDSIFVSSMRTQADMAANATMAENLYKSLSTNCTSNEFNRIFFCNAIFTECINITLTNNGVTNTYALGVPPCQLNCEDTTTSCMQGFTTPELNCTAQEGSIYNYPPMVNIYNLTDYGGQPGHAVQCSNTSQIQTNGTAPPIRPSCNSPLVYHPTNDYAGDVDRGFYLINGTDCALPCPAPLFSKREWDNLMLMVSIVSPISFCCVAVNLITYLVINRKYDRYAIGISFLSFSTLLMNMSDFFYIHEGWKASCPEPGRYARQDSPSCAAAGFIFQYGAISAILWWTSITFDLWLNVRKIKMAKNYVKHYLITINVVAISLSIAPLFAKQYGYTIGGIGCWIMDNSWLNGTFWIPLGTCLFIGATFIFLIIYEVYKVVTAVSDINGRSTKMRLVRFNLRPFLIIVFLFGEFIYLFGYHFYIQSQTDYYTQRLKDFVMCIMLNKSPSCSAEGALPYKSNFTTLFLMRIYGIELMIFYGFTQKTKRIWLRSPLLKRFRSFLGISSVSVTPPNQGTINSSSRHLRTKNMDDEDEDEIEYEEEQAEMEKQGDDVRSHDDKDGGDINNNSNHINE